MSNFAKKIRDMKDKEMIQRVTGETPKHRCPDCHRFTVWINTENTKHQCLMCKMIQEGKEGK
jgi:ribosomal protein S27E